VVLSCYGSGFGITIQQQPLPAEPPAPERLKGDAPPPLEPFSVAGLFRVLAEPDLYYFEPEDLWYRYWRGAWYQAFFWDGAWFPAESAPEPLREGPPAPR
jgi:hypothetical protein